MAKFIFKMQQMLNIKKQLEKSKQNELANAINSVKKEEEILQEYNNEKDKNIQTIKQQILSGMNVEKLKQYNNYLTVCEEKIKKQQKVVNDVQLVADKIREELIQVAKEKKTLEKLKERKFEEFKKEQLKKEEQEVGEITNYKYIQRKAGEDNGN